MKDFKTGFHQNRMFFMDLVSQTIPNETNKIWRYSQI